MKAPLLEKTASADSGLDSDFPDRERFQSCVSIDTKVRRRLSSSEGTQSVALTSDGFEYGKLEFPPLFVMPGKRIIALVVIAGALLVWACTAGAHDLEKRDVRRRTLLMYVSIPVVSTLFTYGHIWAALYMTFYPLKYRGCLQIPGTNAGCGWQGIVPNKAEKMARISVQLMTTKLISTRDIFNRIDPHIVASELDPVIKDRLPAIIDRVASQQFPQTWKSLPQVVKNEIVKAGREDAPATIKSMMDDVRDNIENVFDLTTMVVDALVRDPELQNLMFIECGYDELVFIRNCGAYMGFGVGVFQMTLWIFWSAGWMLPAFGLVVGCFSNWIALKMIFEPVEPLTFCRGCIVLQGRFLKSQNKVSKVYARIVTSKVLSARNLIPAIITGPCSTALFELIQSHVQEACDRQVGSQSTVSLVSMVAGNSEFEKSKTMVSDYLIDSLPETMAHAEKYFDTAMDLERLLDQKMSSLPPADFERLLHPVFEEDEWKLVLMGGALGVWVGCMQWYVLGS